MFIVFVNKTIGLPAFSRLASLLVGLTAGTYWNYLLENYAFLVYLYYMQPFCRTSTFGQNHAYCIQIFNVIIIVYNANDSQYKTYTQPIEHKKYVVNM